MSCYSSPVICRFYTDDACTSSYVGRNSSAGGQAENEACHSHALTTLLSLSLCLQPDELTNALEISNIVFTSLFSLEMLLKVLVYGPFGYIKNPYNIFDGIIVVIR